ncbi:hypothetical protein CPB83DRAFT_165178 [Crepidotus variabilis]|uniref:PH domain-containing protein n=1 Tax=Crepidotus variabilis TaxID=179855 RepID=A0A9P6JR94_9AGAR|nr:hypothetical protein CPB83DRAFT_165178 [Crepidotus variabilis]
MSSNPSDRWSPTQGTNTFADTFSPSGYSYTDTQRFSSDGDDSAEHTRRLNISPSPSGQQDYSDETYTDENSIDEIEEALHNLEDDYDESERIRSPSQWSPGSYSSAGPTFSSATGTFTYSGTYTGSPSFVALPTFPPRSPLGQNIDPRARLSRITERTEESRPTSTYSHPSRHQTGTPDHLRRSALSGAGGPTTSLHSRSSTEPTVERLVPGRLGQLIAVFESQSPSVSHTRGTSAPGYRAPSPLFSNSASGTATGYGYGSTSYGYGSRPSSPSKSGSGSTGSLTAPETRTSLLSPPPPRTSAFSSSATGSRQEAQTYTSASYTETPNTYSNTNTWTRETYTHSGTGSHTTPNPDSKFSGTEETFSTITPTSTLRKPTTQTSPRSPLASVRNIVNLWKERTPASARTDRSSVSPSSPPLPPPPRDDDDTGRHIVRRRVEGARARFRESYGASGADASLITPTRPLSQDVREKVSNVSGSSSSLPPSIDLNEFSSYAGSKDPPTHIGLLWYLNVHASPPYRWQRCQALLYPHMLLLSWLSPGGGRGIVALDLLNCTSVQSAPSPNHPSARDDVGTLAARHQSGEAGGQPLMDMLVPFQMMYADGVERLGAESLLERQKWVNRIWEAVNRPVASVPDSVSVTRSPTGSIRTILTIDSTSSHTSNGSRSTVFVPPLSTLPDIADYNSSPSGLSRQSSIVSSHHSRTVDDNVIRNQEYIYPGDRRVITPSRGRRRSGSMTDLDDEFREVVSRARGSGGMFGGSPVTISSGSSLGRNIFVTPPPSTGRGSDRARSEISDENFFSAGSNGLRSNVSSTYFSQTSFTSTGAPRTMTGTRTDSLTVTGTGITPTGTYAGTYSGSGSATVTGISDSRVPDSTTFTSTYLRSNSASDFLSSDSPSTLSRARVIKRRVASSNKSYSSGSQSGASRSVTDDGEDKENESGSGSVGQFTPSGVSYDSYTPGSGTVSMSGSGSYGSGSYTPGSGTMSMSGSGTRSGGYTSETWSGTPSGSYTPSGTYTASGSYTPSGSYTASGSYTPSSGYTPASGTGSGSDTLRPEVSSSSGPGGHTPISSSETGYDICPSSDLTEMSRTMSFGVTPTPRSPLTPAISVTLSDIASEKYISASLASTEYETAAVIQSSRASSIRSFQSLQTISDYLSVDDGKSDSSYRTASEPEVGSDYRTASEPDEPASASVYVSAPTFELSEIPSESQLNTPVLSSLKLGEDDDGETESEVYVPSPSRIPSIRSLRSFSDRSPSASVFSELLPEEVPLPPSAPASLVVVPQPLPSLTPSPSLGSIDLTPRQQRRSATPSLASSPSVPEFTYSPARSPAEISRSLASSPSLPPLPPSPSPPSSRPSPPSSRPSPPSSHPSPPRALPSRSPSLMPTPTPLELSEEEEDVATPTSLYIPPPTPTESDAQSESTPRLSLVTSLPPSTLGSTSIVTPTSIVLSSASSLPPSTRVVHPTTVTSSSLSITTSVTLSEFTESSSSMMPPSPQPWAAATDISYESSILQPSPSVRSIALHEGMETSFETSFLRPSGSPSSIGRMSTIPVSPAPITSIAWSPLPPLTPVPALPPSMSSPTDVGTPTSLEFASESSSLGRTSSLLSSSSYVSESDMSTSLVESRSGGTEVEPLPLEVASPSTEPSLLSSIELSPPQSPSPTPIPAPFPPTPDGSVIVSLTTPQGSGGTEQSSLRTMASISVETPRDMGADFDRLVDEVRTYDHARGLEHQDLADNVKALRDEIRGLADYLGRTPSPRTPLSMPTVVMMPPGEDATPRRRIELTDRPVGGSEVMSSLYPRGPRVMEITVPHPATSTSLSRSASNASSYASYLSSHHSDDDLLEDVEEETPLITSRRFPTESLVSETESQDVTSSSSMSSSPLSKSSDLSTEASTARQEVPDALEQALQHIRNQLRALEDGQTSTLGLLDAIKDRPIPVAEDHTPELTERLNRIDTLIQTLIERGHPVGPEIVYQVPPSLSRTASTSESSDSLRRLRSILNDLASPGDIEGPHMPVPTPPSRAGPSIAQQLDEILSASQHAPMPPPELPRVDPFVYRPSERGARARSASPASLESLPARPSTVPIVFPVPTQGRQVERQRRRTRPESSVTETLTQPVNPFAGVTDEADQLFNSLRRFRADLDRQRQEQQNQRPVQQPPSQQPPLQPPQQPSESFHKGPGPPPQPVLPHSLYGTPRPITAPPGIGGQPGRSQTSWYHPPAPQSGPQPQMPPLASVPPEARIPVVDQPQAGGVRYMPMPAGPTVVQLPPLFDSLLDILRENRLAQLATVDQQRELMRYMRGLNEWLERDVHDRQNEIERVYRRVDQLGQDLRHMQMRGAPNYTPSSGSSEGSETHMRYDFPAPTQPGPQFPGLPMNFQPYPDQSVQPPVIPPMVPDGGTPPPSFPVTMPQPTIVVNPGAVMPGMGMVPPIPRDEYDPRGPGPQPFTSRPSSAQRPPFIPSDISRSSTGSPRPPIPIPMPQTTGTMGANVILRSASPSSTRSSSTRRSQSRSTRHGRRRRSESPPRGRSRSRSRPRYDSRSPSRRTRRTSRSYSPSPSRHPAPLVITNPGMIPGSGMMPGTPGLPPSSYGRTSTPHHVVPASDRSMTPPSPRREHLSVPPPQQQPTVIIQQPQQQPIIVQQPPVTHIERSSYGSRTPSPVPHPMGPSHMPMMSEGGMPMTGGIPMTGMPMTGMPMTEGMPMTGMPMTGMPMTGMPMTGMPMTEGMPMTGMPMTGMPMTGMPMTGMPMTGMPMTGMPMTGMPMTGVPMTGMPMTGMPMTGMPGTAPLIVQQGSPRSSRSRSRSRSSRHRHHTPPAPAAPPQAPILITDTRRSRSHSRSPRQQVLPSMMPPGVTVLPSQPIGGMPQGVVMMPSRSHSSGRRRRSRSRSHSHGRTPIVVQPQGPPTMYPAPQTQAPTAAPTVMLPGAGMIPGMGMVPGMMGPVMMPARSRSRSRSRSPRHQMAPAVVIPPQQQSRYSPRRRSYTPEHRRRPYSPYRERYHPRSPSRGHSHYRESSSPRRRSRTPPRHRSRSPSTRRRSRTPPYRYPASMPMTTTVIPPMQPTGYYPSRRQYSRTPTPPHRTRTLHRSVSSRRRSLSPRQRQRSSSPRQRQRSISPRHMQRSLSPRHRSQTPPRRRHSRSPPRVEVIDYPRRGERHPRSPYQSRSVTPVRRGYGRRPRSPYDDPRYGSRSQDYSPRRSISSPPPARYQPGRPRSASPMSPRRSPPLIHRSRDEESPVRRIPGRPQQMPRRSMSAGSFTPPRVMPSAGRRTEFEPTEASDRQEVVVTVPSRRAARPPTVVTLQSDAGQMPGPSRTGTPRRPSVHSDYHSPTPGVHVLPPPQSERSEETEERSQLSPVPTRPPSSHVSRPLSRPPTTRGSDEQLTEPPSRRPSRTGGVVHFPSEQASEHSEPLSEEDRAPEVLHPTPFYPPTAHHDAAHQPTRRSATPLGYPPIEDNRAQIEALNQATDRLQLTVSAAEEAEDRREAEYRHQEEERARLFLEQETQRNEDARQRAEAIWRELESRLHSLPPLPAATHAPSISDKSSILEEAAEAAMEAAKETESIASIRTVAQQAASQHATDVMEMIRLEREEFTREREAAAEERAELLTQLRVEKDNVIEEKDNRIRALEDELAQLRMDFEGEKQQRMNEEAEIRERDREERMEREDAMRNQLGDITNLVQDQKDLCETKKALQDERWEEKLARRQDKEAQMIELRDMMQKIHDDMDADRARSDEDKRENREALERVIEDLQRQNAEQRELLQSLSDSWRADCQRHHEETLDAVRSTADKQVPFNVQGYLDEFSQALATEVRMLLGEVGKIREERRALQHEIGDLLSMKAKYGPGGEYEPDWRPQPPPGPPADMPPPPPPEPGVPPTAKPGWRTVHQKPKKKKKGAEQPAPSTSAPPPPQHFVQQQTYHGGDVRRQLTGSWTTWQPDRNAVTPPSVEPTLMVPGRESPGLFGPRTPSNGSMYGR